MKLSVDSRSFEGAHVHTLADGSARLHLAPAAGLKLDLMLCGNAGIERCSRVARR